MPEQKDPRCGMGIPSAGSVTELHHFPRIRPDRALAARMRGTIQDTSIGNGRHMHFCEVPTRMVGRRRRDPASRVEFEVRRTERPMAPTVCHVSHSLHRVPLPINPTRETQ